MWAHIPTLRPPCSKGGEKSRGTQNRSPQGNSMFYICCADSGFVVSPSAKVLKPSNLAKLLGMDSGVPKKGRLNLVKAACFQWGLCAKVPSWLCLLAPPFHGWNPIIHQCSFRKLFLASPQRCILLSRVMWDTKRHRLRQRRNTPPRHRSRARPQETFKVSGTASKGSNQHSMVSKSGLTNREVNKGQRQFRRQEQEVLA